MVRQSGLKTCEWCGDQATETITIKPARFGLIKGVKTLLNQAKTADACYACKQRLERPDK